VVTQMFKVVDPSEARGSTITAREVLDKASREIDTALERDPDLQSQLLYTMANIHTNLGLYSKAEAQLNRTIDIRRRILGPNSLETVKARETLALVLYRQGQYARADRLARQTLELERKLYGTANPATLTAMNDLGLILLAEGQREESERIDREAI